MKIVWNILSVPNNFLLDYSLSKNVNATILWAWYYEEINRLNKMDYSKPTDEVSDIIDEESVI